MAPPRTYLVLGDGLSLDPVGAEGAGAARQVHRCLEEFGWRLDDRAAAWCRIAQVPRDAHADIIALSVGSADVLEREVTWAAHGLDGFRSEHRALLEALRAENPAAVMLVANVPRPHADTDHDVQALLDLANAAIADHVQGVGGALIDVAGALRGRERILLTEDDIPTLAGASVVATLLLAELRRVGMVGP